MITLSQYHMIHSVGDAKSTLKSYRWKHDSDVRKEDIASEFMAGTLGITKKEQRKCVQMYTMCMYMRANPLIKYFHERLSIDCVYHAAIDGLSCSLLHIYPSPLPVNFSLYLLVLPSSPCLSIWVCPVCLLIVPSKRSQDKVNTSIREELGRNIRRYLPGCQFVR